MGQTYLCDANVVLRLLRNDDPELSPLARKVFEAAAEGRLILWLTSAVVAEITWVLKSHYKFDASAIAKALLPLLQRPGIKLEHGEATFMALSDFGRLNVDYLDALQARLAQSKGFGVISFDQDFRKWPELEWVQPQEIEADASG